MLRTREGDCVEIDAKCGTATVVKYILISVLDERRCGWSTKDMEQRQLFVILRIFAHAEIMYAHGKIYARPLRRQG